MRRSYSVNLAALIGMEVTSLFSLLLSKAALKVGKTFA